MKIKAWEEAKFNRRIKHWGWGETVFFCFYEIVRKIYYCHISRYTAKRRLRDFLVEKDGVSYFDFGGAKLPDVTKQKDKFSGLSYIFQDVFLVHCYHNDNYEKSFVESIDRIMAEGPYGYKDGEFDVTVQKDDVVIDAGAWIGDFSAYAASKGATSYAFEPTKETFGWLKQTAMLNEGVGRIVPVQKGLGDKEETLSLSTSDSHSGGNSFNHGGGASERVEITTVDAFIKENDLKRVDFIKSDIEGFERHLLMGARETMKKFAPKLAICTYHFVDDPGLLAQIIKEANPNYTIVQLRHKLYAAVVK